MKRILSVVFVATLAASTVTVIAQEGMVAPQLRVSEEAIKRAVSPAASIAGRSDRSESESAACLQEPANSWDTLIGAVKRGRVITVTLANSTRVEGRLLAIDARSISIEQPGGARVVDAAEVLRVRYAGNRKRHVIHGLLIGMAAGAAVTVIIDRRSSHPSSVAEAAGLGAIVIGAPAGAAVGALVPSGQLLYEAATVVRRAP
jgi:hypothetical protein